MSTWKFVPGQKKNSLLLEDQTDMQRYRNCDRSPILSKVIRGFQGEDSLVEKMISEDSCAVGVTTNQEANKSRTKNRDIHQADLKSHVLAYDAVPLRTFMRYLTKLVSEEPEEDG